MPEVLTLEPVAPASAGSLSHPSRPSSLPSQSLFFEELEATEHAFSAPLTTPISECFQWTSLLGDGERLWKGGNGSNQLGLSPGRRPRFYLVVFRSIRGVRADDDLLYKADAEAQDEARAGDGLLKYWYGTLNERRECLAMCIWDGQESALAAIHKPKHRIAMQLASQMYDVYTLERYWLTLSDSPSPQLVRGFQDLPASDSTTSAQLTSITKSATRKSVEVGSRAAFEFELIRSTPVSFNQGQQGIHS